MHVAACGGARALRHSARARLSACACVRYAEPVRLLMLRVNARGVKVCADTGPRGVRQRHTRQRLVPKVHVHRQYAFEQQRRSSGGTLSGGVCRGLRVLVSCAITRLHEGEDMFIQKRNAWGWQANGSAPRRVTANASARSARAAGCRRERHERLETRRRVIQRVDDQRRYGWRGGTSSPAAYAV